MIEKWTNRKLFIKNYFSTIVTMRVRIKKHTARMTATLKLYLIANKVFTKIECKYNYDDDKCMNNKKGNI